MLGLSYWNLMEQNLCRCFDVSKSLIHSVSMFDTGALEQNIAASLQVAHRMQVLDVTEDAEFLTQGVSEERVHEIMRQAMARTQGKVKDAGIS